MREIVPESQAGPVLVSLESAVKKIYYHYYVPAIIQIKYNILYTYHPGEVMRICSVSKLILANDAE